MEKVLLFCVDRGDSIIVLFAIDAEWFYKFCDFKKRCKRAVQLQIWAVERCRGKRFDSGEAAQKIPESRSVLQSIWLQSGFEKRKDVYYRSWYSTR